MRRTFNIPDEKDVRLWKNVRLWNLYMSSTYEPLNKPDYTLQDAGLYQGQVIVIEQKNEDGSWPRQVTSKGSYNLSRDFHDNRSCTTSKCSYNLSRGTHDDRSCTTSKGSYNPSRGTHDDRSCTTSDKKDTRKTTRQTEPGFIQSWQRGKSITECLKYSLQKEIHTDVVFKVGQSQKNMQAHKLILSLRSCVFEAMLKGPLAEQDNIVIPDVEPAIFEEFLQYLYTDEVTLIGDNVIGLLYVSKKYDVSTLEQLCLTYLSSSMTSDDACFVMEQAHLYDEIQLMEKSLNCILENGDAALKSAGLISLCHECLVKIAKEDKLEADEKSVFEAAMIWSESACRKQNKDLSPESRREVLGEVITHVRYPLLDQEYFVRNVVPMKVLTGSEESKILQYWVCPDVNVSPFNPKKRTGGIKLEYPQYCSEKKNKKNKNKNKKLSFYDTDFLSP